MRQASARLLRLLSLLQSHRKCSGTKLAERLEVTTRTGHASRPDVEPQEAGSGTWLAGTSTGSTSKAEVHTARTAGGRRHGYRQWSAIAPTPTGDRTRPTPHAERSLSAWHFSKLRSRLWPRHRSRRRRRRVRVPFNVIFKPGVQSTVLHRRAGGDPGRTRTDDVSGLNNDELVRRRGSNPEPMD